MVSQDRSPSSANPESPIRDEGTLRPRLSSPTAWRSTPARTTACPRPSSSGRSPKTLTAKGIGRSAVNYKLRDWLFSRQHFWGEPFPILHELDADGKPTGRIRPLRPEDLPLDLPAKMAFDAKHDEPTPPLDKAPADWLYVDARRKTIQARDEHDAAMGRLVLVLPAVPRSEEQQGPGRSARSSRRGCRSICTSAGRSTPCCTCSTPASGTRCSSTAAT